MNEILRTGCYADVTLVSDDKTEFRAHKAILSSCSQVFHDVLADVQDQDQDAVIYLEGIEQQEIESMLEYIYLGKTQCDVNRKVKVVVKDLRQTDISNFNDKIVSEGVPQPESENRKTRQGIENKAKQYFCEFCDFKSKWKYSVSQHTKSKHENIRRYACDKCEYTAKRKAHIITHMYVHEDAQYECDICNHKFTLPCSLRKHRLTHNGFKFSCNHCNQQFTQQHNLKLHIEAIHNGIKYDCNHCGKQFTAKKNLSRHLRIQH